MPIQCFAAFARNSGMMPVNIAAFLHGFILLGVQSSKLHQGHIMQADSQFTLVLGITPAFRTEQLPWGSRVFNTQGWLLSIPWLLKCIRSFRG